MYLGDGSSFCAHLEGGFDAWDEFGIGDPAIGDVG